MSVDFNSPRTWPELQPQDAPPADAAAADAPPAGAAAPAARADAASVAAAAPAWSLARRIAFRFVFCYLLLYLLPFPLYYFPFLFDVPGISAIFAASSKFWGAVVVWTGAHVLHLSHPVEVIRGTGSGDTTHAWVQIVAHAAFAALVTLAWTLATSSPLAAKRTRDHRRLDEWLRIYVRYALGSILLSYGMAKVIKTQFPFPSQDRLLEPIGEASPMGLLWTFMGVSTPYTVFAGAMEVLGGVLLFFRRTTTLGALVTVAVMTNVFMLNMCYDVPVKQYSLHLLLMAVFLLAPDLGRLANVLVLHRPTVPASLAPPLSARWARIAGLALCVLFLGYLLFTNIRDNLETASQFGPGTAPKPPVYGAFEVEEFIRNGRSMPPLLTDAGRWRRLTVLYSEVLSVRWMDDSLHRYWTEYVPAKHTIALADLRTKNTKQGAFTYSFTDKDHLVLQGTLLKDALTVKLRKLDPSKFLLVRRGFHWVTEIPFNR